MEERKTAAVVLGLIVLGMIFYFFILPAARHKSMQTLSFKSCTIHFKYESRDYDSDIYRASQNKLALCLCSVYEKKPDTSVKNKVIKIYKAYHSYTNVDSVEKGDKIDSILKYKIKAFDTLILVD